MSAIPPTDNARVRYFMDRAVQAEERIDRLEEEIALLRANVKGALNMDPTMATTALGWIGRAERAEALLGEAVRFVAQRSLNTRDFPAGWVARAEAQLKSAAILQRDQAQLMERPDAGDYWTTEEGSDGKRRVLRKRRDE